MRAKVALFFQNQPFSLSKFEKMYNLTHMIYPQQAITKTFYRLHLHRQTELTCLSFHFYHFRTLSFLQDYAKHIQYICIFIQFKEENFRKTIFFVPLSIKTTDIQCGALQYVHIKLSKKQHEKTIISIRIMHRLHCRSHG